MPRSVWALQSRTKVDQTELTNGIFIRYQLQVKKQELTIMEALSKYFHDTHTCDASSCVHGCVPSKIPSLH